VSFTTPKTWSFGEVLTSTDMNTYVRDNVAALMQMIEDIPVREKRIAAFTGDGSWTVPAGVTYAIAHMRGGGGGIGQGTTGGNGGTSSVAFSSGTVSANGGNKGVVRVATLDLVSAGLANTGNGAGATADTSESRNPVRGGDAQTIVAAATVTPAASITVTVGSGGSAGTQGAAGGSGYVYIEYYEEV
jgi:hypothetical protein